MMSRIYAALELSTWGRQGRDPTFLSIEDSRTSKRFGSVCLWETQHHLVNG